MPKHIPCPTPGCGGSIKAKKTGPLLAEERTGLLVRECLVECCGCGRRGKMLVTLDIGLYLDEPGLALDHAPFPTTSAA
jgi:hypothetical protein